MKTRSFAAGLILAVTATLAAFAVITANAQPAPPENTAPVDGRMDPIEVLKRLDGVATPPKTGDDKAACDRAAEAQARFAAGRSTAQERSRAFEHAKSMAATGAMRRAIDSGFIPACPPDGDPTEVQP